MADILGEGDVWAKVGTGDTYWRVVESVLAGVWRLEGSTADGQTVEWIEIGPVPQPILTAAAEQARATIEIPKHAPQGAMNALPLLVELQERSRAYQPGQENHVINFTLLPITEVDTQLLTSVLGQIPLVIRSGGYGSSRVFATGLQARLGGAVHQLDGQRDPRHARDRWRARLRARRARGLRGLGGAPRRDPRGIHVMSRPFEGSYMGDGSKIADDTRLECGICWWVYDPALGDEDRQIAPGTAFRLLPDTWSCPNCDADKSKFMVIGSCDPRGQRHGAACRECLPTRGAGD